MSTLRNRPTWKANEAVDGVIHVGGSQVVDVAVTPVAPSDPDVT
jgi:hypothetical protein